MSLASARLLMRTVTASRAHVAAAHTGRIGPAATYARCAPLHNPLSHARRGFASAVAASDHVAAASSTSSAAPSSASPSLTSLQSQLSACVKSQQPAEAQRLIREFELAGGRSDVAVLTQWVSCHQKAADWQGAEQVWARISELGLKPSNVSYRTLINVYTSAGGEQLAKIDPLLAEMRQSGVQFAAKDYQSLLKCAHHCKLPVEVQRWCESARAAGLFDSMDEISRRIAAQASSFSAAASSSSLTDADYAAVRSQLKAAMAKSDAAAASRVIAAFEQRGGRCERAMLNMLIGCHDKSGNWQGAERAWARFGELSLKPSNVSYRTLINVYTQAGGEQLSKIAPLLAEMRQCDVHFAAKDYQSLLKCAHHCKLPAEVQRWCESARVADLFDSMDEASRDIAAHSSPASSTAPSSSPLTAAYYAAVNSQLKTAMGKRDSATAWQIVGAFEQRGCRSTLPMLNMLINSHQQAGDWEGAERAWARIPKCSLKPTNHSYCALIHVYTRAGGEQLAKIDPLLTQMQRGGVQLSVQDYQRLIATAHRMLLPAEVRRWSAAARAAGLFDSLDATTCSIASLLTNRVDSAAPSS